MTTYTPSIGSISHGTLQTRDLMVSFADELDRINPAHILVKRANAIQALWTQGWEDISDSERVSELMQELLQELQEALSEYAPPYCYFGTTEGDGSDFGFWPSMDQIEELPKISDPSEMPDNGTGEDTAFVNDHGNVTVYSGSGKVILELV